VPFDVKAVFNADLPVDTIDAVYIDVKYLLAAFALEVVMAVGPFVVPVRVVQRDPAYLPAVRELAQVPVYRRLADGRMALAYLPVQFVYCGVYVEPTDRI